MTWERAKGLRFELLFKRGKQFSSRPERRKEKAEKLAIMLPFLNRQGASATSYDGRSYHPAFPLPRPLPQASEGDKVSLCDDYEYQLAD